MEPDLIADLREDFIESMKENYAPMVIEQYEKDRRKAADALEAQAKRIAELEAALRGAVVANARVLESKDEPQWVKDTRKLLAQAIS